MSWLIRKAKKKVLVDLGSWLIAQFVTRSILMSRNLSDHGSTYCKLKNGYNVFAVVSKKDITLSDFCDCTKSSGTYHDLDPDKAQAIPRESHRKPEPHQ
ncbi:MAG: hypothetical protein MJZ25_05255 [Fibrobacter sp.]|nr:hypothetical protein [Fibrobacter sp.]